MFILIRPFSSLILIFLFANLFVGLVLINILIDCFIIIKYVFEIEEFENKINLEINFYINTNYIRYVSN